MTKYFYILFLSFVFSLNFFGQEIIAPQDTLSSALNDYELTDRQYSSWKVIRNNWIVSDYEKVKAENKITVNCKNCESFYLEVVIKVNSKGKMEHYKVLNSKRCGIQFTKQLELRMMRVFFKFDFPPELSNTTFKTRLGSALKC